MISEFAGLALALAVIPILYDAEELVKLVTIIVDITVLLGEGTVYNAVHEVGITFPIAPFVTAVDVTAVAIFAYVKVVALGAEITFTKPFIFESPTSTYTQSFTERPCADPVVKIAFDPVLYIIY